MTHRIDKTLGVPWGPLGDMAVAMPVEAWGAGRHPGAGHE